jgi:hypothetical protein
MPEPAPNVVAAFAAFVRQLLSPRQAPRNVGMVIVAAAAPFAPTAQARARLLRQAHASGLLTAPEAEIAQNETRAIGAPQA